MRDSEKAEKAKKEIIEYNMLKRVPLVIDYSAGLLLEKFIPGCIKRRLPVLFDFMTVSTMIFSVSLLPILYAYNRGKADEEDLFNAE